MRAWLQHHLNALHVLAFLVRHGVRRSRAHLLAQRWEALAHPWLYYGAAHHGHHRQ